MHLKYEILLRNCINTRLNTDKTNHILKLPHIPSNKNFYQTPHSKIAWSIMRSEMIWNAKQLSQDRKIWCRTFNKKRRNKKEIPLRKALVSLLYSTCFQTANKQKSLIRERFFMTRIQCLFFAACSWKPLITRTFYALWNHFLFGMHRNKEQSTKFSAIFHEAMFYNWKSKSCKNLSVGGKKFSFPVLCWMPMDGGKQANLLSHFI